MGQGRDMSLAYILVTATYMLIGASFYIAFPLPKSCIEDVSITAINIMTTFPTSWLSIFHLAVNLEKLSLWPSLLITRTCWTTSTSTTCWRWPPRSSSSSRCSPSSPSSCTSSGILAEWAMLILHHFQSQKSLCHSKRLKYNFQGLRPLSNLQNGLARWEANI